MLILSRDCLVTALFCLVSFLPAGPGTKFSLFSEKELSSSQLALHDAILGLRMLNNHMYASDSTRQKFDVSIGVASLPHNATRPVERPAADSDVEFLSNF